MHLLEMHENYLFKENAYFKRKKRKCLSVSLLVRKEKNMEGKTGEKIGKEIRFYKVFK